MKEKEFHIINVGVSIVINFQKSPEGSEIKNVKLSDNETWEKCLDDRNLMNKFYEFVKKEPKRNSAELNAFLRKIENSKNKIEVYFTGTKTPINEICVRTLERFMKEMGFTVYTTKEFPGYFLPIFYGKNRVEEFKKGISEMLDHLIKLAKKKKEDGYEVYFNPTGGFKAHVIACALAGFITNCEVYYINEEFNELIIFPPLFYIPKNKEIELLERLKKDKKPKRGKELNDLLQNYEEEIDHLNRFGLLELEINEASQIYGIKITSKGCEILEKLK